MRRPGRRRALAAAIVLLVFNVWHLIRRDTWDGSLGDTLTLGPQVRAFAARVDPSLRVHKPYDGQFYYAIAYDPWLRTHAVVGLLDDPAYRYRRLLLPALASVVALGNPVRLPAALLGINVSAWLLCGAAAWRLARRFHLPAPWLALGVLTTTGLVYSTFRTLAEPVALACVLWGLLAWSSNRRAVAGVLFGLGGLAHEGALVVPLAVAGYAAIRERRSPREIARLLALALTPAVLWWLRVGFALPPSSTSVASRFGPPFVGLARETAEAFVLNDTQSNLIRSVSVAAVTLWLGLEALLGIRRAPTLWGFLAAGCALLCSTVRGDVWAYYAGSVRIVAPLSIFSLFWFFERSVTEPAK